LDAHPGANDVLSSAGMQGAGAEQSVRDYFVGHPQEYQELRGIAAPLIDMQHSCGPAIQPMQIAALYTALSQGGTGM
jgi:hemophore-related protein